MAGKVARPRNTDGKEVSRRKGGSAEMPRRDANACKKNLTHLTACMGLSNGTQGKTQTPPLPATNL